MPFPPLHRTPINHYFPFYLRIQQHQISFNDNISSTSSSNKEIQYDSNNVAALKEWAIICKAAEDGKQVLLFRKGGIMEYRNGFELKYKNFFLFPTFEHQSLNSIQG